MDVIPLDERNKSKDSAERLSVLLSCMFNDSFYHRNVNLTLLILATAFYTATAGFLLSSRLIYSYGNISVMYIFISFFLLLFGIATIEQFRIIHRKTGFSFLVIHEIQNLLGFLKNDFFGKEIKRIVNLPKEYKNLYNIDYSRDPHIFNSACYAVGIRGYFIYSLYIVAFSLILYIIVIGKIQYESDQYIIAFLLLLQILHFIVRILWKFWNAKKILKQYSK